MEPEDDFHVVIDECIKLLDENVKILSDMEYSSESAKEDAVITDLTKNDLITMAHEVADSSRIKKAESDFARRYFERILG
jgi:hypothetical protein